jgi:hypothetical protein
MSRTPYTYKATGLESNSVNAVSKSSITSDEKNVYYSVTITNPSDDPNTNATALASFSETRSTPIVDNPSEFKLSVTRFETPGTHLPLQIMRIEGGQTDVTKTIYGLTLNKGVSDFQSPLFWIPEDARRPVPTTVVTPVNYQYASYYSMRDYQTFCDMFNSSSKLAFLFLKAIYPGIASTMGPILTFDKPTQLFSIYVQQSYIADGLNIYLNSSLCLLFQNTLKFKVEQANSVNGKDCLLVVENQYNNIVNAPLFDSGNNWYVFTQEFPNNKTQKWQSVNQIVITSDLPTRSQLMPNIATNSSVLQQTKNNEKPVLVDFNILDINVREGISYFPTAQYRYLDLLSTSPLNTVNIQAFWVDSYQNFYPIILYPGELLNLLILFEKK